MKTPKRQPPSTMSHLPPPESKSLPQPPTDGVTSLSYLPKSSLLGSTSWDGSVRIHDTSSMSPVLSHAMDSGPLLSIATLSDTSFIVTGGLDGSVRKLDIQSSMYTVLGRHSRGEAVAGGGESKVACSCLASVDHDPLVASAGWDCMFHLWDARNSSSAAVATVKLPGKAFGMDYDPSHSRVVVATSGRRNCFLDIRKSGSGPEPLVDMALERESSLKYQTRTIKFFPDGSGVALGSIEGRVAVEFLDDLGVPSGKKKYAFKCHRDGDVVYPVNAIAFHPVFGTFATGGCDGTVVLWDGLNKKKLSTLPKFPTSIAALAFNHDGSELAIASSYTFEEGDRDHPRDEIFVREMLESECKPKTAK